MRTIVCVILIALAAVASGDPGETYAVAGGDFTFGSVGVIPNDRAFPGGAALLAVGCDAYVVYEIKVPPAISMFSANVQLRNPRRRNLHVYVWNYGTRREQRLLSKPGLDARWMKWETCLVDSAWRSRSPEYMTARDAGGSLDFAGDYGLVRIMLYADGGMPPREDALFFIGPVSLRSYPITDVLRQVVAQSGNVWIEGDTMLVTEAIGNAPDNVQTIGQARAMARRAATTIAQRNLTEVIGDLHERTSGSTSVRTVAGTLVGARVRSSEDLPDGRVKVTMEMPVSMVIGRRHSTDTTSAR